MAPASAQGAFIVAGHTFDAYAAVGKALNEAKRDVFILDKYAYHVVLRDFAILAPENVSVRLLAKNGRRDLLKPAIDRWHEQWGSARPLAVRLVPEHTLHDRAIFVDGKTAWSLGQSFNDLAKKSHTTLARMPPEVGGEKIAAYEVLWSSAAPLS